ncbi:hypothetical protein [Sphingomonas gellani]|nr:hypothetical protein [Sphingomonas gellani]
MALFLVATADPAFSGPAEAQALAQFARHGFRQVTTHELAGWRLLHAEPIAGGPATLLTRGDDLVAVAGTPMIDGLIGTEALERLLTMDLLPQPDWRRIGGQFFALVRKRGRTILFGDFLGAYQLFHDRAERVFSTSQLATIGALPRVSFDPQGVYEWAFGVATIGNATVWNEIAMLGPERLVELTPGGAVSHPLAKPLDWTPEAMPLAERVRRLQAPLMRVAEAQVRHFGEAINCPLSGGFDSRLMLATLRAAGGRPQVYVYGSPSRPDVAVAKAIGAAEGFAVEWIDKQAAPVTPDAFAEQVERDFDDLDGLPNFGVLFDNGGNRAARDKRHAGGALAVSGGAGEIFRDFFMLPDRPASAWTLTRAFNSRFLTADATELFDPVAYRRRIADKVAAALGVGSRDVPMPRTLIEQAYPRVRMRALFRWEINGETRHGPYSLNFVQPDIVSEAMRLPVACKREGRFQAMLIQAIDPALARHKSEYGHAFDEAPKLRWRFDEANSRSRPLWLRERAYALKRLRGPMSDEHGGLLTPEYMGRVIDMEFPIMSRFFNVAHIRDAGLWRRVACLEYMAQRLGSRLAT